MAVTTGSTTGSSSSNDKKSSSTSGSGGQRGAGSNYGPGSGKPGTTSASQASTAQTSAPGKTDKEAPAPTSAAGKADKVGTSEATKKPGLSGITSESQMAAFNKQKDLYTQAGGASVSMRSPSGQKESAKVVDPSRGPNRGLTGTSSTTTKTAAAGKTDNLAREPSSNIRDKTDRRDVQSVASGKTSKGTYGSGTATEWGGWSAAPTSNVAAKTSKQPTANVARPTTESFIDSLVNRGPAPAGALTVGGSLLGAQPTSPSLAQAVAMDPISFTGPRAGATAATPMGQPNMGIDQAVSQLADIAQRAQQGTLLSAYAAPAPKIADRVPATGQPSPGPATPSMPDPRLAQLQEQFNRIAAGRNQPGKVADVAAPMPGPAAPMPQSIPSPISTSIMPQAAPPMGQVNSMYRDPMAQAKAVRAAVAMALGQAPTPAAPTSPLEIDVPGYPAQVAPSQQGILGGNVFNRGQRPRDLTDAVNLASAKARGVGDTASPLPSAGGSIAPSQDGNYPPDENFVQDAGQADDWGQIKNRADYERDQVMTNLKELPQRLFDAITRGDIRGFTPETNDKRPITRPQQPQQPDQTQIAAVARLLALLKAMEQQGGNQSQADLVNSTFI